MSGGLPPNNWRGFGLPPVDALTLYPYDLFNIPRSHHHSSDESDSGSPSGGFGGSHPSPHAGLVPATFGDNPLHRAQQPSFIVPGQPYDDAPFVPHRPGPSADTFGSGVPLGADLGGHRRIVIRPPESHDYGETSRYGYEHGHSGSPAESDHSMGSDRSVSSMSSARDPSAQMHTPHLRQASFNRERYPAYDQNSGGRIGLEHLQYEGLGRQGAAQGHYRTQTQFYPSGTGGHEAFGHGPSGHHIHSHAPQSQAGSSSSLAQSGQQGQYTGPPTIVYSDSPSPSPSDPLDTASYLRRQLALNENDPVDLYSLPDPPPGEKPNYPYPTLIKLAIYGSPRKQLTLQEIYSALEDRFTWFRDRTSDKAWKNSIRHNLSLNKVFRHVARPITEPGKGSYWRLDVSQGEGNKRLRKRRPKGSKAKQTAEDEEDEDSDSSASSSPRAASVAATERASRSAAPEDDNIDPELKQTGHVVGEGRTRSNQRRMGTTPPYQVPGQTPSPVLGGQARFPHGQLPAPTGPSGPSPSGQFSRPGSVGLRPDEQQAHPSFGRPAFGQPSFGQPTLATRSTSTSLNPPNAFISSSSEVVSLGPTSAAGVIPRPTTTHDRSVPILQLPPRPGIEYVRDESGLPSARRVATLPPNAGMEYRRDQSGVPTARRVATLPPDVEMMSQSPQYGQMDSFVSSSQDSASSSTSSGYQGRGREPGRFARDDPRTGGRG